MTNPTTPFSWQMPTSSDLVTDLPADFETFGQAVATSMADLLGGTTGQVLSKASNTDMDFTWVAQDDSNAIQNAIVDAKGDLIAATGADTPARLAVGANDLLLTAASGEATGLKYTGAWTTFTPTWNNLTVGNAVQTAKYCQIGKVVFVKVAFKMGTTSSIGSFPQMNHPVGTTNAQGYQSNCLILDAGTAYWIGTLDVATNAVGMTIANVGGTYAQNALISATVPMTWTTNDEFQFSYWYEVV
jgi:hypothetical protein